MTRKKTSTRRTIVIDGEELAMSTDERKLREVIVYAKSMLRDLGSATRKHLHRPLVADWYSAMKRHAAGTTLAIEGDDLRMLRAHRVVDLAVRKSGRWDDLDRLVTLRAIVEELRDAFESDPDLDPEAVARMFDADRIVDDDLLRLAERVSDHDEGGRGHRGPRYLTALLLVAAEAFGARANRFRGQGRTEDRRQAMDRAANELAKTISSRLTRTKRTAPKKRRSA